MVRLFPLFQDWKELEIFWLMCKRKKVSLNYVEVLFVD